MLNIFTNCSGLKSVTVRWKTPLNINSDTFEGVYSNATLYVPAGCRTAYGSANNWKNFKQIVEKDMVDIISNGNLEGNDVSCFYVKDVLRGNNGGDYAVPSTIAENKGKNGSRSIEIQSAANPVNPWDTQFFIRLPQTLPAGTNYYISFDYKASQEARGSTEVHAEPCDYIYWEGIGDVNFTTDWQHFESMGTISAVQSPTDKPMHTLAFQLAEIPTATTYYFDNIVFEIAYDYENILFADATVKALCVAKWDTNGDGELSGAEAAAVTDLGTVFRNTSIKSFNELSFFTGLKTISNNAFNGCSSLTSVVIPNSVTTIGDDAFHDCSGITSFTIPNSVTSIGHGAFYGCSGLPSITIPNSVTSIGYWAFCLTGISSIVIPANVTFIGAGAFGGCVGVTSIKVEAGNTVFDSRNGCNAIIQTSTNTLITGCKNTTIPEGITSIGDWAFNGMDNLTSIVLPSTLTSIGEGAFSWCWTLPSITIPANVTSIGNGAFSDCGSLTSVIVESSKPVTINSDVFTNRANATLYVPKGSKSAYAAANYWKEFNEIVEMVDIVSNGNLEGNDVSCFYVKDVLRGNNGWGPVPLTIANNKGKDGSRGFEIQSANNPSEAWDTQFFIRLPQTLPAGTRYHVSFDYKASKEAWCSTQVQAEPGDYIHWVGIGDVNFTTQWQHFDGSGTISTEQSPSDKPMRTLAFQLAEIPTATTYYFDNIVFEIEAVKGDVNGDGVVDVADIASIITVMAAGSYSTAADVNGDGWVDVADIASVISIMSHNARKLNNDD